MECPFSPKKTEMECFSVLPEGCISHILSLSSPGDTCRSSAVSWGFKSAADSDTVWERFLPSDLREIIERSVSPPLVSATKKQLYFSLCDSPILLDHGNLSFGLDRESGKKCYMIPARQLSIAWQDTPQYWEWISLPYSRFAEVAKLKLVCWLDIRGKTKTKMLSPKTIYKAYLVFKLREAHYGLESVPMKASVKVIGERENATSDEEDDIGCITVYLQRQPLRRHQRTNLDRRFAKERKDGKWMEIELGEFFNDEGDDDGEVEMRLKEIKHLNSKSGLLVERIELRPKVN